MEDVLLSFLPPGLAPEVALILLACSTLTSLITAALGAGGGVMLLALMAMWIPPAAIIPVQGLGGPNTPNLCYSRCL